MKEWMSDAVEWVKDRCQERTTLDGVVLVAMGLIALFFQGLITIAAYVAIVYGVWTMWKSEW
jgi:hypothetical protein